MGTVWILNRRKCHYLLITQKVQADVKNNENRFEEKRDQNLAILQE